jgi:hypothetical protein
MLLGVGLLFAALSVVLAIVPVAFLIMALSEAIRALGIVGWLKNVPWFPQWKGGPADARPHVRRALRHPGLAVLCSVLSGVAGSIARWTAA